MNFVESLDANRQTKSKAQEDREVGLMLSTIRSEVEAEHRKGSRSLCGAFYGYYYDDMTFFWRNGERVQGVGISGTERMFKTMTEELTNMGFTGIKIYNGPLQFYKPSESAFFSHRLIKDKIYNTIFIELNW